MAKANFRILTTYGRQNELMRKSIHPVEMRGLDLRVVLVAFISPSASDGAEFARPVDDEPR